MMGPIVVQNMYRLIKINILRKTVHNIDFIYKLYRDARWTKHNITSSAPSKFHVIILTCTYPSLDLFGALTFPSSSPGNTALDMTSNGEVLAVSFFTLFQGCISALKHIRYGRLHSTYINAASQNITCHPLVESWKWDIKY